MEPMDNMLMRVTNNFIDWGNANGAGMSPLKLQKLMYLVYARYLYSQREPLFEERFEKWPKGPVLRDLYEMLKVFGGSNIEEPLTDVRGKIISIQLGSGPYTSAFREVAFRYGWNSANELIRLTHSGPPGADFHTAWAKTPEYGDYLGYKDILEDGGRFFA